MTDKTLRTNQGVNFHLLDEQRLIHFLYEWFGLECSRHFVTTTVPPEKKGDQFIVQVVPRGLTASEDAAYFNLLDRSLKDGPMQDWKTHAEILPRLETVLGIPAAEPI